MTGSVEFEADAYDIVGVGFGPANLALSIAAEEAAEAGVPLRRVFLERKPAFGWHRGMLFEDATMQVSFLKDLATPRNPLSRFGFVPYLWARGRLSAFINHKTLFPTRVEFHDYLEWAAAQVAETTRYGIEAESVRPVVRDGEVVHLEVQARRHPDGLAQTVRARNVVLAPGLRPVLPDGVTESDRIWHSSGLLTRVADFDPGEPYRFAVLGAGQSAAEVVAYLHGHFAKAEVHAVLGRYGYSPSDDSPFANRVFDPAAVDEYFGAPEPVKRRFFDYHANTNYSVVDMDLLNDLYGRLYREEVTGHRRLRVHHMSALGPPECSASGVTAELVFLPDGRRSPLRVDYIVYATGYAPTDPLDILGPAGDMCERDDRGRLLVGRDYRVVTRSDVRCGIYLQGGTEHTHGISSSLLSNVAVRAGDILASVQLAAARPAPDLAAAGLTGLETR
ncbi:lysine N(6)-hydroxylase/L-ornithine N(5)-oxygenase family protein [Micromonospora sp. DT4]|uniref:lysine N(6)-hydroxylase/L-ornithine N(5)-oxygenase family protein n=1 Tax=Micromonospora sp. DT4 TaxID=3393438 RepID=UPI003CF800FC